MCDESRISAGLSHSEFGKQYRNKVGQINNPQQLDSYIKIYDCMHVGPTTKCLDMMDTVPLTIRTCGCYRDNVHQSHIFVSRVHVLLCGLLAGIRAILPPLSHRNAEETTH